jgi:hypothetical protein
MTRGIIITALGGKPPIIPDVTNPNMASKIPMIDGSSDNLAISAHYLFNACTASQIQAFEDLGVIHTKGIATVDLEGNVGSYSSLSI